jgi:putative membrane protein insertion efficiency factor
MTVATPAGVSRPSLPARGALLLVHGYQRVTANRPSPCRYVPTCSNYALDAYEQHGFVRGSWLNAKRIGRCHPWASSGWDPVPGSPSALAGHPHAHQHDEAPEPVEASSTPSLESER